MKSKLAPIFLLYLRILAKIQLAKTRPVVIGVGGASGKTSLSRFISLILEEKFKVLETRGKNSSTGIPLSILKIKPEDHNVSIFFWPRVALWGLKRVIFDWDKLDFVVAEMGIDAPTEPNNMSYLLKIVKPKVGVLTNIAFEHSQYFEPISKGKQDILLRISKEESLLLKVLPKNGVAIVNLDDKSIRNIRDIKAKKITVGKNTKADFSIQSIEVSERKFDLTISHKEKSYKLKLKRPLPLHYATTFTLAIATCSHLGFGVEDSIKILQRKFSLPPGRLSIFKGVKNTIIIDSSYNNATLKPLIDILELLRQIGGKRRKVAILGDMREQGSLSRELHESVANKLLETSDLTILIGPLMTEYALPILRKNNHNFYNFQTFSDAKNTIKEKIKEKDLILVKGSQNTLFLERVVEMLLKDKKDKLYLCRRGKYWDKRRTETP
jgi:UDP-N-acetylmuramoyl-tripeptide--D-alanyl-D-alanine ligase